MQPHKHSQTASSPVRSVISASRITLLDNSVTCSRSPVVAMLMHSVRVTGTKLTGAERALDHDKLGKFDVYMNELGSQSLPKVLQEIP